MEDEAFTLIDAQGMQRLIERYPVDGGVSGSAPKALSSRLGVASRESGWMGGIFAARWR